MKSENEDFLSVVTKAVGAADGLSKAFLGSVAPQVDVEETKNSFVIKADLPGYAKNQLQVSVEDSQSVTISGERPCTFASSGILSSRDPKLYSRIERPCGQFTRTLRLPKSVNVESVSSKLNNGVLEIILQKSASTNKVKVNIE
ncbi:heat shock protein Hsp20 [Planoprotostelium fungivorum]|uniref:Heat shock protein Hsp20 n=1 Tax=Planoprotostelium fungivorum TaxID=1890364 RepID=A0A2P6NVT4_9EUKA|nr:heat shock protein Hsp20 [Planoprotostelium fungivorum]